MRPSPYMLLAVAIVAEVVATSALRASEGFSRLVPSVIVVIGYVVMPEHFHLLLSEPQEGTPATVMQALKLGYARHVLAQLRAHRNSAQATLSEPTPHHVWQARFYDFNVWTSRKRVEKLRYMHRNPVQRGLVESPELWPWSSYRAYALGEAGAVRVNDWQVLKLKIRKPAA